MGYLFLSLALLANTAKGYCGKKTSGHTNTFRDAMAANCIRMVLCILIGFVTILLSGQVSALIPDGKLLWITALSGISTAIFVVTWLVSVKGASFMMVDIFLMLGVLIPLLGGQIRFHETIRPIQWLGWGCCSCRC